VTDVFNEVEEQLRSQQYEDLLRRGWPYAAAAAGVLLLGALGFWGWNKHVQDEAGKASVAYQAGMDAGAQGHIAEADKDFGEAAASSAPAYRALGLMQQAQIRLDQNKTDEGVRLFDEAAKVAPDPIIGDVARLKAAYALMDGHPLSEIEPRLQPLATGKGPYKAMAMEALAMARLQAGKFTEAKDDFTVLSLSQDASQTAQARAHAAIDLIQSGSAAVVPATVKAAALLPASAAQPMPPSAAQAAAAQIAAAQAAARSVSAPQAGAAQ